MIEIDPRNTKDGSIVLQHDTRLERTTNGKRLVPDFALQQLRQLQLVDSKGNVTEY